MAINGRRDPRVVSVAVLEEPVEDHVVEIARAEVPGGASTSQTIMISSLQRLLALVPADAPTSVYRYAIIEDNVLAKQTVGARQWAYWQLKRFYRLDPSSLLFRALRDMWPEDAEGQPLLALLCALARDRVLRASAPVVMERPTGATVSGSDFESVIHDTFPGVYGDKTRRTTSGNLVSSWTQSGHLHSEGPRRRVRGRATCTPGALAYALMLGHLQGARGELLFATLWAQVLDQGISHLHDQAFSASRSGLIDFRSFGGVVEVAFRGLLRPFDPGEGATR